MWGGCVIAYPVQVACPEGLQHPPERLARRGLRAPVPVLRGHRGEMTSSSSQGATGRILTGVAPCPEPEPDARTRDSDARLLNLRLREPDGPLTGAPDRHPDNRVVRQPGPRNGVRPWDVHGRRRGRVGAGPHAELPGDELGVSRRGHEHHDRRLLVDDEFSGNRDATSSSSVTSTSTATQALPPQRLRCPQARRPSPSSSSTATTASSPSSSSSQPSSSSVPDSYWTRVGLSALVIVAVTGLSHVPRMEGGQDRPRRGSHVKAGESTESLPAFSLLK